MRTLTSDQKQQLAEHISKKPIQYIELYNELYDHYASTYENGDESLEKILEKLDSHFDYQKVKVINAQLVKKSKTIVNEFYWRELKSFLQWPNIISTLLIIFIGYLMVEFLPIKFITNYILMPLMCFLGLLLLYTLVFIKRKKYGKKRFDSAHFNSSQHYLSLPISIFNITLYFPALFFEAYQPRLDFFESHPFIPLFLIMMFLIASYLGLKVFMSKIKLQYI